MCAKTWGGAQHTCLLVVEASAKSQCQRGELEHENVRDQKWKAKCAQACVKSDPNKKVFKKEKRGDFIL